MGGAFLVEGERSVVGMLVEGGGVPEVEGPVPVEIDALEPCNMNINSVPSLNMLFYAHVLIAPLRNTVCVCEDQDLTMLASTM